MKKRTVSEILLALLLLSISSLTFNVCPVKADHTWSGIIYIHGDGSIEPAGVPISTVDNVTYTLMNNIVNAASSSHEIAVSIERDNIILDGAGYTLQGVGASYSEGISLSGRSNVTVRNLEIAQFDYGIKVYSSSNNAISDNIITNNLLGIALDPGATCNIISRNRLTANTVSIHIYYANSNNITENSLTNNWRSITLGYSRDNRLYHNTFFNNTEPILILASGYANIWDCGFPSGGNYWSDYEERYPDATEIDDSGIWDSPYVLDEYNQDNYPLMEPWTPSPSIPTTIDELKTEIEELGSEGEIDNRGIVRSLFAKLNVAQRLVDKGKIDEAKSILEDDFIPQVQNLSGIHITVETADILIESAEHIIAHL